MFLKHPVKLSPAGNNRIPDKKRFVFFFLLFFTNFMFIASVEWIFCERAIKRKTKTVRKFLDNCLHIGEEIYLKEINNESSSLGIVLKYVKREIFMVGPLVVVILDSLVENITTNILLINDPVRDQNILIPNCA